MSLLMHPYILHLDCVYIYKYIEVIYVYCIIYVYISLGLGPIILRLARDPISRNTSYDELIHSFIN